MKKRYPLVSEIVATMVIPVQAQRKDITGLLLTLATSSIDISTVFKSLFKTDCELADKKNFQLQKDIKKKTIQEI